jgi:SAM-dependent methyltransferase
MPLSEPERLLDEEPPGVIRDISPGDEMYEDDIERYLDVGRSALRSVRLALAAAGAAEPGRVLDLPCGHGRVMRMLKAAFPDAELTACDIDEDGIRFCAEIFGAAPVLSRDDPSEIAVEGRFDLIWCGSLLTHFDAYRWPPFLSFFAESLAPGGVLVFTTHGETAAERWRTADRIEVARPIENVIADYEDDGFGYSDYPSAPKLYGLSISSPSWVCAQLARVRELRLVGYAEAAWGGYQDVVSLVREA